MNDIIKASQIKFKLKGTTIEIGGIGVYLKRRINTLLFVICADGGGYIIDPDDIDVIQVYEDWVPFSKEIIEE